MIEILREILPQRGNILDLGCGNGDLMAILTSSNPALSFTGLDLHSSPHHSASILAYDGVTIPFPDNHFDYVMLITVLHHADAYLPILREARRVCRKGIILLDHQYSSRAEWLTIACIDWPGNVPFNVYTPFNYKTREEWSALFRQIGMNETYYRDRLYMFGKTFDFLLGRKMHFLSFLEKAAVD